MLRFRDALEDGYVRTGGQLDAEFIGVGGVIVVLGETFTDFSGGNADDWIGVGVVAGWASEDLHTDGTLLDLIGVPFEGLFDDEAQEGWVAFALEEERVGEEQVQLRKDGGFFVGRLRKPKLEGGAGGTGDRDAGVSGRCAGISRRFLGGLHVPGCSETV
jgi:hypothetical protein